MGRSQTERQIINKLNSMTRYGESRHKAKEEQRRAAAERGEKLRFGAPIDGIYSYETYHTYRKQALHFLNWCRDTYAVGSCIELKKLQKYAPEYLDDCEKRGLSPYSIATRRAALSKLFGVEIRHTTVTKGHEIKRSRQPVENDKGFSEKKNADLVLLARSMGGRRSDILKITPESFFKDKNGLLWCKIKQSKGGKDRIAPVLPENRAKVADLIARAEPNKPIIEKISHHADIHAYRREYAQALYLDVCQDKRLQGQLLAQLPPRSEPDVSGSTYYGRGNGFSGNRDDIYIVSQALGHNRLSVSVRHYLI
jgi:integrase